MWIEVRCYLWRLPGRVAPRLAGLLRRHLVAASASERLEVPLSSVTDACADEVPAAQLVRWGRRPAERAAMDELMAVLDSGCREGVISRDDRMLLLDVVATASESLEAWLRGGTCEVVSGGVGPGRFQLGCDRPHGAAPHRSLLAGVGRPLRSEPGNRMSGVRNVRRDRHLGLSPEPRKW